MHNITKLDNGLTVVTERMPNMHSAAIGFWIKTGGRYEPENLQGISHFTEHLLFKGTKNRDYKQIKEAIEGVGGAFNAFTAEEYTCYYVKIVSKYLDIAVDVLSDMVLNPLFKDKEINKEKHVIVEEIRMYKDMPSQYVHELLDEMLWPNHPLGRSLLGTFDTIAAMTQQNLIDYKKKYHTPSNIIITASGDIDNNAIMNLIKKQFNKKYKKSNLNYEKAAKKQNRPNINFHNKPTEQTHICMAVHGLNRTHPDRYAERVLNVILGGNMSSRLFNEVREKRSLAYEIGSGTKEYTDSGALYVHAGVDNNKAKETISVIVSELEKFKLKKVTEKELTQAKEYYKGRLLMGLEDNMANMMFLGEQITSTGNIFTKDEIIKMISNVDFDTIKKTAKTLFMDKSLNMAIIGPQDSKEKKVISNKFKF